MIAEAFLTPQSEAVYSQYAFAVYPDRRSGDRRDGARRAGESRRSRDAARSRPRAMARLINERTRLVFVANPNNPTGTWVERGRAAAVHRGGAGANAGGRRRGVYRIRRASRTSPTRAAGSREFPNLLVTRTFSKAYGLAGLRVGYALSHPCGGRHAQSRAPAVQRQLDRARCGAAPRSTTASTCKRSVETNRAGMAQLQRGLRRARRASPAVGAATSC